MPVKRSRFSSNSSPSLYQGDAEPQRLTHCHHFPSGAGQGVGDMPFAWTSRGESSFVEKLPKLDILVYLFAVPAWPL